MPIRQSNKHFRKSMVLIQIFLIEDQGNPVYKCHLDYGYAVSINYLMETAHMIHNQHSFYNNIHKDLKLIVREALAKLKFPASIINEFDSHSTICISLAQPPDINISIEDGRLIIWSSIVATEEELIEKYRLIIPAITTPSPYSEGGSCQLLKVDGGYELRSNIRIKVLQDSLLDEALIEFHRILIQFY
ncbi:hypothetical protein [Vibrio sp.]|uniref:InvB/SpaK family type III secretion system chaperone n=1 Tax=Vibrio sp. TaxID=678 RepID=UPI00311FE2A2